jgi:hypothetical protein
MKRKSLPQYICKFNNKRLFVIFYTNENDWINGNQAQDIEQVTPTKPFKENNYTGVYDDIFWRMENKRILLDRISNDDRISEKDKKEILRNLKEQQSDEGKQKFLEEVVRLFLNFEIIRPTVKLFIDQYMKTNPQYTYASIFTKK